MKYIAFVVLFVIFSLASTAAWAVSLVGAFFSLRYAGNIMHSMDMTLAAILGWDGRWTVSKECGRELVYEPRPCHFCRIVCTILDKVLEPGHCVKDYVK